MTDPDFPIFDRAGCPYEPGTPDHVAYAVGFRAALLYVLGEVAVASHSAGALSTAPAAPPRAN